MAGLIYFIPDVFNIHSKQLHLIPERCQLQSILKGASWDLNPTIQQGPEKMSGCALGINPAPNSGGKTAMPQYLPDKQRWVKVENEEGVTHFIGWYLDTPPKPQDFIREEIIDGSEAEMKGNRWLIPTVHAYQSKLPRRFFYRKGKVTMEIAPEYEALQKEADRFYNALVTDGEMPTWEETYLYCCRLLAVNYRLGFNEIGGDALDLLGTNLVSTIVCASLGFPQVAEEIAAQKKTLIP